MILTLNDAVAVNSAALICNLNYQYCRYVAGKKHTTAVPWEHMTNEAQLVMAKVVAESLRNPAKTPREQHERWMIYKVTNGWTYGETANAELKQHPNIVHWELLSPEEQYKDAIFCTVVLNAMCQLR